ncbi:sugar ABC transporter ATP-binding protein [bacterium AH-315-K03]|nr:sugar ABC transporter ATP-binding protein [bacterium AH-315-K03]
MPTGNTHSTADQPPLLEMRAIGKTFPGVKALDHVNLQVRKGEIHAICGENGAGKSTLMKILSGVYPHGSYEGDILLEGRCVNFGGICDSEREGIVIIHQELALIPQLSIAENIFLGNEIKQRGVIDWAETHARSKKLLEKVGLAEQSFTVIEKLGVGKQQLVEIAKALSKKVKLLILDEPTAALQEDDSEKLLDLLLEFKAQGISSILISHKLNEISQVADSITVLRDGSSVSTMACSQQTISEEDIIRDMVGRELAQRYPEHTPNIGETLLEVQNWNVWHPEASHRQVIHNLSLKVGSGEIVGIAGLMGSGRTEFAMSLFGRSYGQGISGTVKLKGQTIDVSSVKKAIDNGLAYVTEDRKNLGLILDESILKNTTLANLSDVSRSGIIDQSLEQQIAEHYRKAMRIRTPSVFQKVLNLSGGNQQKVVLGKWLHTKPDVLILDEPTRGIDVGAKFEIYSIINQLADEGKSVILISSEMSELLGLCDRIYVMNEGAFAGELAKHEASQEKIMSMIVKA